MVLILLARLMGAVSRLAPAVAARIALVLTRRTRRPRRRAPLGSLSDRFRIAGGEVVVFHHGAGNPGPRVLLVHGWNGASTDWHTLAGALIDAGCAVTALDLPAHGASRGRVSSLPRFVRGVTEADRRHGPFDVWVAHSMGAAAVLAAIAGGAYARKVVLVNGLVDPAGALRTFAREFGLNAPATRAYLDGIEREERMALAAVDGVRNASGMRASTLVVHDTSDRVIPFAHGERLAAALPDARLLRTSGLGHRRILDDRSTVASVVAFATG